jgi:glutathione S-transferase
MAQPRFLLHHAPQSRSFRILWLLEEAGADYALLRHDLSRATQKAPAFLALNPFGKVPVLEDRGPDGEWRGVAITESAGICAYVADTLPGAGLAPAVGTPERAAYAGWMAYAGAVLEPAFADQVFPRAAPPPPSAIGWPDFAAAVARIEVALGAGGPFLLGARFSAADLMVGSMLRWVAGWGKLTPGPALAAYLGALEGRPALARAQAKDRAPPGEPAA